MVVAGYHYGPDSSWVGTHGAGDATADIEGSVYRHLAAGEALAAIVGDRIFPDIGDGDPPRPFVVYSRKSSTGERGLDAALGIRRHTFLVVSEAVQKDDARALAAAVRDRLDGQTFAGAKRAYWADESSEETEDGYSVLQTYTVIQ
jgi:hypothetical protein